jgi:carboxyl-terminal processing protease
MNRRRIWSWLVIAWACAGRQAPAPAEPYDRAAGLATFDAAWRIVHDTHFDTTFNGVDWAAERDRWRPAAEAATDTDALRSVIDRMLDRLGQSHFSLIPREAADTLNPDAPDAADRAAAGTPGTIGDLGLDTRLVGDDLVVTAAEPGGPAAAAGGPSGRAGGLDLPADGARRRRDRADSDGRAPGAAGRAGHVRQPAHVLRAPHQP